MVLSLRGRKRSVILSQWGASISSYMVGFGPWFIVDELEETDITRLTYFEITVDIAVSMIECQFLWFHEIMSEARFWRGRALFLIVVVELPPGSKVSNIVLANLGPIMPWVMSDNTNATACNEFYPSQFKQQQQQQQQHSNTSTNMMSINKLLLIRMKQSSKHQSIVSKQEQQWKKRLDYTTNYRTRRQWWGWYGTHLNRNGWRDIAG